MWWCEGMSAMFLSWWKQDWTSLVTQRLKFVMPFGLMHPLCTSLLTVQCKTMPQKDFVLLTPNSTQMSWCSVSRLFVAHTVTESYITTCLYIYIYITLRSTNMQVCVYLHHSGSCWPPWRAPPPAALSCWCSCTSLSHDYTSPYRASTETQRERETRYERIKGRQEGKRWSEKKEEKEAVK